MTLDSSRSSLPPEGQPERQEIIAQLGEIVREHYLYGACDIRLVVSEVPRADWAELDLPLRRRAASGEGVKVTQLGIGVAVEFVPRPAERREARVIPLAGWPESRRV